MQKKSTGVICAITVISIFATMVLSGCGKQEQSNTTASTQAVTTEAGTSQPSVTKADKSMLVPDKNDVKGDVIMWYWDSMGASVEAFHKCYPNANLKVIPVTDLQGEYIQRLQIAVAAGTDVPDIGMMEMSFRGKLMSMDIWDNLEAEPYNLNRNDLCDFLVPLSTNEKNQVIGIETIPSAAGMCYRKQLAKEYLGVDSQAEMEKMFTDWNTILDKGKVVKQNSGGKVFMFASITDVTTILLNQSTVPYIKDGKLNMREALEGPYTLVKQMLDAGLIDQLSAWSPAWYASYTSDKYLFYPFATWTPVAVVKPNDPDGAGKWGVMLPPGGAYSWGGTLMGIPKAAKNKLGAWAFMHMYTFTNESVDMQKSASIISSWKKPYEDPSYYSAEDPYFKTDLLKMFAKLVPDVKTKPLTKYDNVINSAIELGEKLLATGSTVDYTIDSIEKEIKGNVPELK